MAHMGSMNVMTIPHSVAQGELGGISQALVDKFGSGFLLLRLVSCFAVIPAESRRMTVEDRWRQESQNRA